MELIDFDPLYEIKDIKWEILENDLILKWYWPESINAVYIHKAKTEDGLSFENRDFSVMKLCTRSEYQGKGYISEHITERDEFIYKLYPAVRKDNKWYLVDQRNNSNEALICTGKICINQKIIEKKVPFSDLKKIQIILWSENRLDKSLIVYVLKKGGYPKNIEDGAVFEFVKDVNSTQTIMPELIVPKNYFIKIFFTDEKWLRKYKISIV